MRNFDIVVLGASYTGLTIAHKLLRTTLKDFKVSGSNLNYRVVLISPSTHLYWNIAAPRSICDSESKRRSFVPFVDEFQHYSKDEFVFIQGEAVEMNCRQRTITIRQETKSEDEEEDDTFYLDIEYHALVIATGTTQKSELLSLHGSHYYTVAAFNSFHNQLKKATKIVIAGGGPSGVECAGQLATWINHQNHTRPKKNKKSKQKGSRSLYTDPNEGVEDVSRSERTQITLVSGRRHVLPDFSSEIQENTETKLGRLGVEIINRVRVVSVQSTSAGGFKCLLNDGNSINCDLFIPATGEVPNTGFVPSEMLDRRAYIKIDPHYLRVEKAGERVFAIGSCCSLENKTLEEIFRCIPVLLQNLKNDLQEYEIILKFPPVRRSKRISYLKDAVYQPKSSINQIFPLSKFGGIGVYRGKSLPDWAVWLLKGRNHQLPKAREVARGVGSF